MEIHVKGEKNCMQTKQLSVFEQAGVERGRGPSVM
jgi:hypothetical protein